MQSVNIEIIMKTNNIIFLNIIVKIILHTFNIQFTYQGRKSVFNLCLKELLETADRNPCMDTYSALGDRILVLQPDFTVFYNETVILISSGNHRTESQKMLPFYFNRNYFKLASIGYFVSNVICLIFACGKISVSQIHLLLRSLFFPVV